jgi:hypothetical protein
MLPGVHKITCAWNKDDLRQLYFISVSCLKKHRMPITKTAVYTEKKILRILHEHIYIPQPDMCEASYICSDIGSSCEEGSS